jgi:type 1 glutamine amidotransferase/nicotinamidase-related amidase
MRKLTPLSIAVLLLSSYLPARPESPPLKVCLVSGSAEYESDISLAAFQEYLETRYNTKCTLLKAIGFADLPGLEALDASDVALFFTRRLTIDGEKLERVKKYCLSGRPIVAVRTGSHGFQNWLELDKLVLGGNYQGHLGAGLTVKTTVEPARKDHPLLGGVGPIMTLASLYKTAPLLQDAELLLTGTALSKDPAEATQPVAWTRVHNGGRVFYTSLGSQSDFENSSFRRLMVNALFWTAGRKVEDRETSPPPRRKKPEGALRLNLRSRMEKTKGSGAWEEVTSPKEIPVAETAMILCDMWDKHWCKGASERCEALAGKIAEVVKAARRKGVQIIHAPSETMSFYADYPQRKRMMLAPAVPPPKLLDLPNPPLPIDDADGGCDTDEKPWYQAWTRQNRQIDVGEHDGISDNGTEVYNFLKQEGIQNLIILGVHTNMCVLGRSFAIRQMTRSGIHCILVRDLTDTMYDPKDPPHVSHEKGTELVVEYIEKYWAPSISSRELSEGLP